MRYLVVKSIIITSALVSAFAFAAKDQLGEVVTEKNESICKQKFTQELFTQQRIFSSDRNGSDKRRIAERKIEAARQKYNDTASFCDAYDELLTFNPETLDRRPGDAQFD
ncbi:MULTISPECIES: hypothetical protein [Grimontia]|uniref:Uncharacterized protein n=1 Tax=Grimontia marina TaxID=646534 RepID=A0A128FIP9_9GAMM|nr:MULTISPECIES: hypothetical protein [Grimontia]WRW00704.1 hypothetical protein VP504_19850 [Grimontia sp. NTOU-MAR1]CZF86365.1 hypothetical protein GMA8713_04399 [Grimontia marina]